MGGVYMRDKDYDAHKGCCYRDTCTKDLEKCCFMKTEEKKCIIGGCKK